MMEDDDVFERDIDEPRLDRTGEQAVCNGSRANALGALVHYAWCPVHG